MRMRVISRLLVVAWLFGQMLPGIAAAGPSTPADINHTMRASMKVAPSHCTHMKNGDCCHHQACRHCTLVCTGQCNMIPVAMHMDACLGPLLPTAARHGVADACFLPPEAPTLFLRPPISAA